MGLRAVATAYKMGKVTQMPWLDHVWTNNPIARYLRGNIKSPGVVFAMKRVQERKLIERGQLEKNWKLNSQDMLSRFMEVEAKDPNVPPQFVTLDPLVDRDRSTNRHPFSRSFG